jgi:predicted outer membrane repeat protein
MSPRHALAAASILMCTAGAFAARIHVNVAAPPGGNGSSWATARNDLRAALLAANNGDEVWIARGLYRPDTLLDRGIRFTIRSGVRVHGGFVGNETDLAQRPADPAPAVSDPAFDTVISGEIGAPGPADNTTIVLEMVGASSATLVDRVVVRDGSNSGGFGGGVLISSSSPTLRNVLVTGNTSGGGGGIFIAGTSTPLLEDCIIAGNTSPEGAGVTIRQNASVTLRRCTFDSNISSGTGGAIALAFSGFVTAENCTFIDNQAISRGGAIYSVLNSGVTVRDSVFTDNTLASAPAASGGGAISLNTGTLLVERSTFSGNSASQGGAYDHQSGAATFKDCSFTSNFAQFGGAAAMSGSSGTFENCTFTSNTATSAGGAIYSNTSYTIKNCTFRSNSVTGGNFSGGALYLWTNATITDTLFESNTAQTGGAVAVWGGAPTFDRCRFISNSGSSSGGALRHVSSTPTYRNCLFDSSTGGGFGGLLFQTTSDSAFINCTIVRTNNPFGAIWASSGTVTLTNSILRGNGPQWFGTPPTATYSNVKGGLAGTGNIDAEPIFVDVAQRDFRLAAGSAGIDAGNNAALPVDIVLDAASSPRYADDPSIADSGLGAAPVIDMGAYEFAPPVAPQCQGDADGNTFVNFSDITSVLASFGTITTPFGAGDADGNGEVNFSDITSVLANFGTTCN